MCLFSVEKLNLCEEVVKIQFVDVNIRVASRHWHLYWHSKAQMPLRK